jgi:hypothetical protein
MTLPRVSLTQEIGCKRPRKTRSAMPPTQIQIFEKGKATSTAARQMMKKGSDKRVIVRRKDSNQDSGQRLDLLPFGLLLPQHVAQVYINPQTSGLKPLWTRDFLNGAEADGRACSHFTSHQKIQAILQTL